MVSRRLLAGIGIATALLAVVIFLPKLSFIQPTGSNVTGADRAKAESDLRGHLLQALGGLVLGVGAYFTWRTFALNREGQITERFTRAVEQLANDDKLDIRLGGIFALERIAHAQGELSLQGLLLAGMVIAALGVLDDLTVSQSSTVMALRRANPSLDFRGLFRSALSVGHDHIAATVNTLVLAYAGASLPVLLIFSLADTPFSDAINFEAVAEAIVAMLVGSIGLIAAVPITTALAALLATRVEPAALARAEHAH